MFWNIASMPQESGTARRASYERSHPVVSCRTASARRHACPVAYDNDTHVQTRLGGFVAIPDYHTIMLPLLRALADGKEHRTKDLVPILGETFGLSDEELAQLLPSGGQAVFSNRVHWARFELVKAGLLTAPARGVVVISDAGRDLLAQPPPRIDRAFLAHFAQVETSRHDDLGTPTQPMAPARDDNATPEELLEQTWRVLQQQSAVELHARVRQCSPAFFEHMVVDLLVAMGYGGSRAEAGRAIGGSGDGGIDGVINEDPLGLDTVYIQAKRWEGTVGRPVVQNFAGSLEGARARKGVLITTSTFTSDAHEYVKHIEKRIVLIDGVTLADLMLEHNVGVTVAKTYTVKRIDLDYFEEG